MKRMILLTLIILVLAVLILVAGCKTGILEKGGKKQSGESLYLGAKTNETEEIPSGNIDEDESNIKIEEDKQEVKSDEEQKIDKDKESSEDQEVLDNKEDGENEYVNDFTLLDIDKNEVSLSDYKGKIVILNFWATWCPPCREEIPDLIEISNLYKDKDVQLIGVSIDTDIKALNDFVEEFSINYPTWIDGTIDHISPIWGIRAIPTTFILNEKGEVIFENIGMMTKDQLVEILDEILALNKNSD